MMNSEKTLIVIVGPTGAGKTDVSIDLARHYNAPVISTDSRQVFKGMAIGTAQPDAGQLAAATHYFIAEKEPWENFTCGCYEREAINLLNELFRSNDIIIAVGGSGLYIDALCNGMDEIPDVEPALREKLNREFQENGIEYLSEDLRTSDPEYYEIVDRSNPQRIIRALEVIRSTGRTFSSLRAGNLKQRDFRIIKTGISLPREILYERINKRVDKMMEAGLEQEARDLYRYRHLNSLKTVGYKELFEYFDGLTDKQRAVELIKRNSRRYAKRQITWFSRYTDIEWFGPDDTDLIKKHINRKITIN